MLSPLCTFLPGSIREKTRFFYLRGRFSCFFVFFDPPGGVSQREKWPIFGGVADFSDFLRFFRFFSPPGPKNPDFLTPPGGGQKMGIFHPPGGSGGPGGGSGGPVWRSAVGVGIMCGKIVEGARAIRLPGP